MKFIADVMLGKLAKRLRLLGYDVAYDRSASDNDILRISLEQDRVILTRDTALAKRPLASRHFLIAGDREREQVKQVVETYGLQSEAALTRCSVCNAPLVAATKEEVRDIVPPYVLQKHHSFMKCGTCGRIYWEGTHAKRMNLKVGREYEKGKA